MNGRSFLLLLVLSLVAAAAGYHFLKEKKDTDLDRISRALQPLKEKLPPSAHLYYLRRFDKEQRYSCAEYCLAPRVISPLETMDADSVMMIIPREDADTIAFYRDHTGKLLWENTDDHYHYLLINAAADGKK